MKIVIKIGTTGLRNDATLQMLSRGLGLLLAEGHRLIVVHGGIGPIPAEANAPTELPHANGNRNTNHDPQEFPSADALVSFGGSLNKAIVATLSLAGVPAFGLCGADGNMFRLRRFQPEEKTAMGFSAEVTCVSPFWLDVISKNGGVPVLVNIGLGVDRRYHVLYPDQMAGACAIGWNADALIYITDNEGVRDQSGTIIRWLAAEKIVELIKDFSVSSKMVPKLTACREALKHGVRRARILPLSQLENLPLFYFAKIESGTEVILGK